MARSQVRQGELAAEIDSAVAEAFGAGATPKHPELSAEAASLEPSPETVRTSSDSPPPVEVLPARMLNEFVYCPRLFYYEFVEGVFVHNADTMRGAAIHARVDAGSGAMPSPDSEEQPETIHSRSVSLGSERLGVTAKIDLVEGSGVSPETPASGTLSPSLEPDAAPNAPPSDDLFSRLVVCPVDYKAGAPREGENGKELWDADKMQLGLQCLLLRDNGYVCNEGIIYYRATRQRVRLEVTPELEAWVLRKIAAARTCAAGPIPAPLVDSPKCPRCSLVTVCLPDETRLLSSTASAEQSPLRDPNSPPASLREALRAGATPPPRRLIAARDDSRALYLTTPGLFVGRSGEVLQIKEAPPGRKRARPETAPAGDKTEASDGKQGSAQEVRINDLSHVALFGNIQISTAAVQALCEADIPITYFSMGGWFYGFTRGHSLKNVFTRVEQFRLARDPSVCLWLARSFVLGKIRNQRTMLMRNHVEPPAPILAKLKNSARSALAAQTLDELLGVEGAAASFYFQQFNGMIKVEADDTVSHAASPFTFDFAGRKRRPPTDPVNALLSLAYSLLAKDCTIAAHAVGLDPYIGFYHQPRFGRPALALDIMEEFRPLIAESAVLTAINNRMITEKDFVRAGRAVNLSAPGRKQFFVAYEQRMSHLITHPIFEYKVTYRRALELQFRILARYLTGEIEEYVPFMTR